MDAGRFRYSSDMVSDRKYGISVSIIPFLDATQPIPCPDREILFRNRFGSMPLYQVSRLVPGQFSVRIYMSREIAYFAKICLRPLLSYKMYHYNVYIINEHITMQLYCNIETLQRI